MDVIALNLGELSIALELDNDHLRAGMASAKKELEGLPPVAQREMVKVSRVFKDEGDKSGGLLAQGVRSGLVRSSPLIVAAISAALAAGAPTMIAAAGLLFAGVGAVAAAQTLEVRAAWSEMGREIRDGAVADAAVLIPVFVSMSNQIGAAFERLRPQLRKAFEDSAPLIQSTTDGIIALGENAMPGLVRAVAAAGPVFDGFESFLAATGDGLTGFFDAMSSHSPAAGAAFASLGDIMATLLPLLGELLGQGAELAATVLPLVSGALSAVLAVVQALGPALPAVVAGFVAMKIVGTVSPMLATLATNLALASANGGVMAGTAGRMSSAVGALSGAVGPLSVGIATWATILQQSKSQISGWTTALNKGGEAARQAKADMAGYDETMGKIGIGLDNVTAKTNIFTASTAWAWDLLSDDTDEAREANERYLASLSPMEAAQRNVGLAQEALARATDKFGPASNQAEGAARVLTAAQAELERQSADTEMAISGVTSAMIDQANQALAAIDSGFAYRNSVDQLEDAQATLEETIRNRTNSDKNLRTSQEDVARASLAVEEQTYRTALAFAQQQADLSGLSTDSLEYKRIVQEQMLGELYRLQAAAGPEMAAAIGQQITALQNSGVALTGSGTAAKSTADKMRDLGIAVTTIPGNKTVFIDAPTADQKARLEGLGYTVRTLPNGKIFVTADTGPAAGTLAAFINQRRVITIQTAIANGTPYQGMGGQPRAAQGGGIENGRLQHFEVGGAVRGPGGPTSDQVPALLSNGEHVWTAREVAAAGGQAAVADIRKAALAGAFRYADGGPAAGSVASPSLGAARSAHITVTAQTNDERRIAAAISRQIRDDEFLVGVR